MEFLILLPPSLIPVSVPFLVFPILLNASCISVSLAETLHSLLLSFSHSCLIYTNEHESMSFIYLKNKCNHSLLPSTVATLSKQPPSPALVRLAVFFLVFLLLLFSQHSSQDDSFEMEVQLSYSYVQNPSVAFYIIYSKNQNIAVLTRPSITSVFCLSDYVPF